MPYMSSLGHNELNLMLQHSPANLSYAEMGKFQET